MLEYASRRNVAVVLLCVPRPPLFCCAEALFSTLAREHGAVYEGEIMNAVLRDPGLKSDSIHPNAAGYRRIAERLAALLRERGAL
jgi:lysophospholipase L1-like esterase